MEPIGSRQYQFVNGSGVAFLCSENGMEQPNSSEDLALLLDKAPPRFLKSTPSVDLPTLFLNSRVFGDSF